MKILYFGSFIVSFSNKASDPEKDSADVQEFLASIEGAFWADTLSAGTSEEELESAGEVSFLIIILFIKWVSNQPYFLDELLGVYYLLLRMENIKLKYAKACTIMA